MRPRAIHQVLAALSYGDAIGNESLAIRDYLKKRGYESEIFAEKVHPKMAALAHPLSEYAAASGDDSVCLFHFSIGSAASSLVYSRREPLVSIYHNITPRRVLRPLPPAPSGPVPSRQARTRGFRGPLRARARGQRVQPQGTRGRGLRAYRRPAHRHGLEPLRRNRQPRDDEAPRGLRRPHHPLRGPRRSEQEVRGRAQVLRRLPASPTRPRVASSSWATRPAMSATSVGFTSLPTTCGSAT
jgi:hypothetical protein